MFLPRPILLLLGLCPGKCGTSFSSSQTYNTCVHRRLHDICQYVGNGHYKAHALSRQREKHFVFSIREGVLILSHITMLGLVFLLTMAQLITGLYIRQHGMETIQRKEHESEGESPNLRNLLQMYQSIQKVNIHHFFV